MTFAPAPLIALGRYWTAHGGYNLGVVGDTAHQQKGTSYHLGKSQLTLDAYSRILPRDKAGLSEAASAIDLGKLGRTGYPGLRKFSVWLAERCKAGAPGTDDIREVIFSPDGTRVQRWDNVAKVLREGGTGTGQGDDSHRTHTHISFYRDSEKRDKVGLFRPYFEDVQEDGVRAFDVVDGPTGTLTIAAEGTYYLDMISNTMKGPVGPANWPGGKSPVLPVRLREPLPVKSAIDTDDWKLGFIVGQSPAFVLARNVTVTPTASDAKLREDLARALEKISKARADLA